MISPNGNPTYDDIERLQRQIDTLTWLLAQTRHDAESRFVFGTRYLAAPTTRTHLHAEPAG